MTHAVQVYEYAPGDEADRWVVYVGEGVWTMDDEGEAEYAGAAVDLFRAKVEGRPVSLAELPAAVRVAVHGLVAAQAVRGEG